MSSDLVIREHREGVATLILNRPGTYNAFGLDMARHLLDALRELDDDPDVKVCILTGAGDKAFCSGANLQDEATHRVESVAEHLHETKFASGYGFFEDLLSFRKPLICAVNGYAIGAGFLIPLCCDVIFASKTAQFKLPQTSLGILPAYGGTTRLAQYVGRGRAMEIALSGRAVDALEAERIGIVARAVDQGDLGAVALTLAESIAALPDTAVRLTKESLRSGMEDASLKQASVGDLYRFIALSFTSEAAERHESWRRDRLDRHARR